MFKSKTFKIGSVFGAFLLTFVALLYVGLQVGKEALPDKEASLVLAKYQGKYNPCGLKNHTEYVSSMKHQSVAKLQTAFGFAVVFENLTTLSSLSFKEMAEEKVKQLKTGSLTFNVIRKNFRSSHAEFMEGDINFITKNCAFD